jgi:tetratricopeptide (TPR) repeat protein
VHAQGATPSTPGQAQPAPAVQPQPQQVQIDALRERLALQQDFLEKRSAEVDKRADELEHLISQMTLGTTVYSLFLGLLGYLSLTTLRSGAEKDRSAVQQQFEKFKETDWKEFKQDLEDRANKELEKGKSLIDDFKNEVRRDVPHLARMERSIEEILGRLYLLVDRSKNWTRRASYDSLPEEARQDILIGEMTVAAFDFFGLRSSQSHSTMVAEIYTNFSRFYGSRSKIVDEKGRFHREDMARALIYSNLACDADCHSTNALNQRAALVLADVPEPGIPTPKAGLEKAAADLHRCLEVNPDDSRALYNLAWATRRFGDLPRAIELLTRIIDRLDELSPEDRGRRVVDAFTNRACYRALVLAPTLAEDTANDLAFREPVALILADCLAARKEARAYYLKQLSISPDLKIYCRNGFRREFSTGGELESVKRFLSAEQLEELVQFE